MCAIVQMCLSCMCAIVCVRSYLHYVDLIISWLLYTIYAKEPLCTWELVRTAYRNTHTHFFLHSLVHILWVLGCKEECHDLRVAGLYSTKEKKNRRQWLLTRITHMAHADLKTDLCRGWDFVCMRVDMIRHSKCDTRSSIKSLCLQRKWEHTVWTL